MSGLLGTIGATTSGVTGDIGRGDRQEYWWTSGFEGNWVIYNLTSGTSSEHGIRIQRQGRVYGIIIGMQCSPSPSIGSWTKLLTVDPGYMKIPSRTIHFGHWGGNYFSQEDMFCAMHLDCCSLIP